MRNIKQNLFFAFAITPWAFRLPPESCIPLSAFFSARSRGCRHEFQLRLGRRQCAEVT